MEQGRFLKVNEDLIGQAARQAQQPHKGMVFWLTGLSGAGKSTLAYSVERELFHMGCRAVVLDGDNIRTGVCRDLSFSYKDRVENIRRVAEIAKLFIAHGTICFCALISPIAEARTMAKSIIGVELFREIYISCSLGACESRDVKGFYKKARKGEISGYTGVSQSYEEPCRPDLLLKTDVASERECVAQLLEYVKFHVGL